MSTREDEVQHVSFESSLPERDAVSVCGSLLTTSVADNASQS
jgi:hypothetical protein